jgi:hypothetical protein
MEDIKEYFRVHGPDILKATIILIVGWILAWIIAGIVRKLLRKTSLDNRLVKWMSDGDNKKALKAESWISNAVYYILLLVVFGMFFERLNIPQVSEPLRNFTSTIFDYVPKLLAGGIILALAWIIGTILKLFVTKTLTAFNLDDRFNTSIQAPEEKRIGLSNMLGNVVYWLPFLFLLPAFLGALDLNGLLGPVTNMMNKILGFLPNLAGAVLLLVVGWFVVKIIKNIIVNLLASLGVDNFAQRFGLNNILGSMKFSDLIGKIVAVFISIPIIVAALNALEFEGLTLPATNLLNNLLAGLPSFFSALLLGFIGVIIGRLVGGVVTNFLSNTGFDAMISRVGITVPQNNATKEGKTPGTRTPSQIVGTIAMIATILFIATEALRQLGFEQLSYFATRFVAEGGNILIGLLIFAVGLYIARLIKQAVMSSGLAQANILAMAAQIFIVVLASSMALSKMGLATNIVNLAFGLILGAFAVAAALAFGLGGRDAAGRVLNDYVDRLGFKKTPPAQQ